jgi:replicative superfamily II helicase
VFRFFPVGATTDGRTLASSSGLQKVKLLIIDEVHLLNEERGAVIETIVARTLRQVESSQSLIRIVGLSATLPNYVDVSDFLRVSRYHGQSAGVFVFLATLD